MFKYVICFPNGNHARGQFEATTDEEADGYIERIAKLLANLMPWKYGRTGEYSWTMYGRIQ